MKRKKNIKRHICVFFTILLIGVSQLEADPGRRRGWMNPKWKGMLPHVENLPLGHSYEQTKFQRLLKRLSVGSGSLVGAWAAIAHYYYLRHYNQPSNQTSSEEESVSKD